MGNKLHLGWPNRITIARLLLIWPFALCLLYLDRPGLSWLRWLAIAVFAAMAISDVLDGYLARRLQEESQLGRFLDPLADKLLITVAVLMLCVIGIRDVTDPNSPPLLLPGWVAVIAIGKDLVVSIGCTVLYLGTGRFHIQPRIPGKCCTVVQLLLVLSMLLWLDLPVWLSDLPRVLWWVATALAVVAAIDYIRLGTRYLAAASAESRPDRQGQGDQPGVDER